MATSMHAPIDPRELWLAYRLDELAPGERHAFEERLFAEESFADLIEEAVIDLREDYLARRIAAADAPRVERALGAIATADRLLPEILRLERTAHTSPPPSRGMHPRRRRAQARLLVAAVGLAAVTLGGTLWLRTGIQPPGSPVATLLLHGGTPRGATDLQLAVRARIGAVRVQWVRAPGLHARRFRLHIYRAGDHVAAASVEGRTQNIDGTAVVEFRVPAASFVDDRGAGTYLLTIAQATDPQRVIVGYSINVRR